ncbi:MAG: NAD(+) diphosphatase [Betaproteobacteria bacterium]|nr:NAD(+) diphosphatase [Betaproteobacteria bacterium]MDH5219665.1 NAD(+) diphosphatase [Betaproteobacteria bacterium]MDH5350606.1 NAD(+) diphosphatase [Betaproteobacteria bacterium]
MPFMTPAEFAGGVRPPQGGGAALWFVFRGDQLLVELGPPDSRPSDDPRVPHRPSAARLPLLKNNNRLWASPLRTLYLGALGGLGCWAAEVASADAPSGYGWTGMRSLFTVLEDAHFALAGRALQLLQWDRDHQFCGRCGAPTEPRAEERVRVCPACSLTAYPRVAPAVMALVRRGRELLLGRSPHFPPGMYSALAGFVEPGETLEQCVARELAEEVGVTVTNLSYFASQPWPFPHSLMIAFVCDWADGAIRPEAGEIEAADWFDVLQLPKLPSKISIARRLIDAVSAEIRRQS